MSSSTSTTTALGAIGGVGLAAASYVYLAPMLGYSDMIPKLIVSSGFILSGDQLGTDLASENANAVVADVVAIAAGVGIMILVQPAVAGFVSNQILQALLLGPACAVVVGLIVVAAAEALIGVAGLGK